MSLKAKLVGLFNLSRFELPFSAGICVVLGQLLAAGEFAPVLQILLGFLSVFFISASILVLNDYFDIETDKINAPHRPLPANIVSPEEALFFALFLMLGGLICSAILGIFTLLFSMVLLIIGFLYNRKFKKSGLAGNFMVSFSVGMTFIYGGLSIGLPFNTRVWFFGIIAALVDLGEEIAADAMDMEGDAVINSRSLAIRYGRERALVISTAIFYTVVLMTALPFIMHWFKPVYLIPILIMDIAIAYPAFKLLKSRNQAGRKYIRMIYLGATAGLVLFIVMRLFGLGD